MVTNKTRRVEPRVVVDIATELLAWGGIFLGGRDWFCDLELRLGIRTNEYHQVPAELARAAWNRLGPAFLASERYAEWCSAPYGKSCNGLTWAEEQFGAPDSS
jgi:hypothetical protein